MSAITKHERDDLQRLIRQREKVLKSAAKLRSAEVLADFENQMGQDPSIRTRFGRRRAGSPLPPSRRRTNR
jgi:hypothetical protein